MSGRHGDTVQLGTARSGTVPTRPDTVRHGPAWRGLTWQIEVRGLANRSEGLGAGLAWALSTSGTHAQAHTISSLTLQQMARMRSLEE